MMNRGMPGREYYPIASTRIMMPYDRIHCGGILWYVKQITDAKWIANGMIHGTDPNKNQLVSQTYYLRQAGGAGVEYYFGYSYENSDLTCQDYASREKMWRQSKYALDYFRDNQVPFQDMMSSKNLNSPVTTKLPAGSTDWLLSSIYSKRHVVYRKVGNATGATLTGLLPGTYDVKWYNPRAGGPMQRGSIPTFVVTNTAQVMSYGLPPNTPTLDWVVNIKKMDA